jgi:hypothetical protein
MRETFQQFSDWMDADNVPAKAHPEFLRKFVGKRRVKKRKGVVFLGDFPKGLFEKVLEVEDSQVIEEIGVLNKERWFGVDKLDWEDWARAAGNNGLRVGKGIFRGRFQLLGGGV